MTEPLPTSGEPAELALTTAATFEAIDPPAAVPADSTEPPALEAGDFQPIEHWQSYALGSSSQLPHSPPSFPASNPSGPDVFAHTPTSQPPLPSGTPRYPLAPPTKALQRPPLSAPPPPSQTYPPFALRSALIGAVVGALTACVVAAGFYVTVGKRTETVINEVRPTETIPGQRLDVQQILTKVRPSVVTITTDVKTGSSQGQSTGSGVVIDRNATILTNAHVIDKATRIQVQFSDGTSHAAKLRGSFPEEDVAVIVAEDVVNTAPAELGSSEELQVGDDVVAIGNALNLGSQPSVTKGIVAGLDRSLNAQGVRLEGLIQTDAAINPGNSGGPLVNTRGQVVGINTAIIENSQNVGFSLAIDRVKVLVDDILAGRAGVVTATSGFLGVVTTSVSDVSKEVLDRFGVVSSSGAFVQEVQPGSGADTAGIKQGDVIVAIDGQAIENNAAVGKVIRSKAAGDVVSIEFERNGTTQTVSAELSTR